MAGKLTIDQGLIERALAVSGESRADIVVTRALEEFIARRSQKQLLELIGKLDWDPGFDRKRERGRD
jgi:hypothetical protein